MEPIEYQRSTTKSDQLDEVIELAQAEVERFIRHIVHKFGGFKLIIEDGPMRADDKIAGVAIETGDSVRITIRPKFGKS